MVRTVPPDLPRSLVVAGRCWFVAIGAGVFETVLATCHALLTAELTVPAVAAQVSIRLVVFAVAGWLTLQLWNGRNAARIALTVVLSVLGLLSLLIGPVEWFTAGHQLREALAQLSGYDVTFAASRVVHVVAVIAATVLMYRPSANRHLGGRRRRASSSAGR